MAISMYQSKTIFYRDLLVQRNNSGWFEAKEMWAAGRGKVVCGIRGSAEIQSGLWDTGWSAGDTGVLRKYKVVCGIQGGLQGILGFCGNTKWSVGYRVVCRGYWGSAGIQSGLWDTGWSAGDTGVLREYKVVCGTQTTGEKAGNSMIFKVILFTIRLLFKKRSVYG